MDTLAPPPEEPVATTYPDPGSLDPEQTSALLAQLSGTAVLVVDRDLRYVAAGGSGLVELGWDPAQLLGRTVHDLVGEPEASVLAARYRSALDGRAVTFQHRSLRAPDTIHEVEVVPIPEADGTVQRILVLARDITRRLRSEQALQASEQRLRELSESSPDMLALYAPDGTYLEVSGSVRELFGWTPEDLIGTSSYAYFHPEDLATIRATHDAVLERPDPGVATYRLRCRDGSYRWVEVSGRSLTDPDTGEVRAIQCTTRDITRRHEAEAALAAANAALLASNHELDRLAAVASHDLRSPLATARNLLDLVPDRLGRDHDPIVDELVERARGQLARMTESVDALLELARLGRQRLEPQRFPLGGLLAEVLEAIGPELVLADVSVRLTRDATIVGDRRQLRLLLQNLLSNTRHAAGGERPVRVEVAAERLPDGGWSLTVTDDGDGLREPTATGGGDPTRTDLAGTGSRHTGLGFGLATCARIAERHHANLYLDHLATGTRVRLQVPPADARPRATGTLPAHERPATDP